MTKKQFKRIVQDKKESPAPESVAAPKSVPVQFVIDDSLGKYISFIENLRMALADHKDPESMSCFKNSDWRKPHILLPKQIAPGPARWIEIELSEGEHNTTLFVRDDNVYLVGFENKNKKRYQAGRGRGCGGQSSRAPKESEKMPDQILKDATPLGYDLSYRDLGGDSSKWKLGIFDAKKAVRKLSAYGTEENPNECIRQYLVTLIVMICEAARMCRIEKKVKEGWSSKGIIHFSTDKKKGSVHLTTIERDTLNQWEQMSQAMMGWGDYTLGLKKIEVRNDKEAGEVVRLIKYAPTFRKDDTAPGGDDPSHPSPRGGGNGDGGDDPRGTSPGDAPPADAPGDGNGDGAPTGGGSRDGTSQGGGNGDPPPTDRNGKNLQHAPEGNGKRQQQQRQQQGRSLVEISSIHLTEGCTLPHVGSITVFDGKRGQIIYWNEEDGDAPRVDSKADLILTGPYRAISAGGRVALRITSVSDSDAAEEDLLIWDPYAEDAHEDIDELVSGDIAKGLMLTYAVLRSAVEATVQVDLFLARGTDFFGEISAHSILANGEEVSVVLFSREIKDRVVFEPSSAGSTVPLTRSVLAWAVGSPLLIKVECCRSVNLTHNGLHLRTNVEHSFRSLEFSFDDQKDKICFETLWGFGDIRVSVDDTREYRKKSDSNSLPRSLDQLSRDHTLVAEQNTMGFREESSPLENQDDSRRMYLLHSESGVQYSMGLRDEQSPFENWDQDDPTRKDILEPEPGSQDSMGPEDIETPTKLLVVRRSQLRLITIEEEKFITCLLHLTNNSNDQHVAFRCGSILVEGPFRQYQIGHSSAGTWQCSGILPPNSTSAYLVRSQGVRRLYDVTLSMTLESCVARQDEKQVNTIFPAAEEGIGKATQSATVSEPTEEATTSEQAEDDVGLDTIFEAAKERTQKVTLKAMGPFTSEQAEGDEDLDTLFSRTSKGIKEVTIKATVSHPADVPITSETEMKVPVTESSINQSDLDIYPLQPRFPFKQDKVICSPLRLTNRTDHYVIFKCLPYTEYSYLYTLDHINGILPPRSACTYVVAMEKQKDLPDNVDALSLNLKTCTAEKITGPDKYISRQDPMHGITTPQAISEKERILPTIEIITGMASDSHICSMDVHPTEPWILAGHYNGSVCVWDYQTQERVMELKVSDSYFAAIGSAKLIAREKWIVAADGEGFIYVVKYTTKEVSQFQAHRSQVTSLAVHPEKQLLLSASYDNTIMLWDWDVNRELIFQRTRTFEHTNVVKHVMFNPYDSGHTFASASHDCTVKIWTTADPKPIATLECGRDKQEHVAYFYRAGRPHMITGSWMGATRVWDLEETSKPINRLEGPKSSVYGCNVGVVNCASDNTNPVLITVSEDGGISFVDPATYEPRYDKVNFSLGRVVGFAEIEVKGKRSLMITLEEGVAIMEMNEDLISSPATLEQAQEGIYSAQSSTYSKLSDYGPLMSSLNESKGFSEGGAFSGKKH